MHQLLACLALGGLSALASAEPVPAYSATETPSSSTELSSYPFYPPLDTTDTVDPVGTDSESSSVADLIVTYGNPPFVPSTSVGPIITGNPSESTAAPIGTGVSGGSLQDPIGTASVPPYANSSALDPTQTSSYSWTIISDPSPTSTLELTETSTIKATFTLTSTLPSYNGSNAGPTAVNPSTHNTYAATGISSGTGTLGGVTANSTFLNGDYPFNGPYTFNSHPTPSTSSVSGTSPGSGIPGYGSVTTGTGVSGGSVLSPVTASSKVYDKITGTTAVGPSGVSSSTGGSGTAPVYPPLGNDTSADPTAVSSSTGGTGTALPYPNGNITSADPTGTAGPSGYPTPYINSSTGIIATETSTDPIDTTCTETHTTTLPDGSTTYIPTTFVTTASAPVHPPVYPASLNSTTVADPLSGSPTSVGTLPILTTAPPVATTSGAPVYSPVITYPVVTPSVPAEYYHHHRRPNYATHGVADWFATEDEEETSEGYGYDDPEDYDYYDYK